MSEIEVTANDTTTAAMPGDEIVLRLPENATTGYQWIVDSVAGPVEVISSELSTDTGAPGAPGAAAERIVRLRAAGTGVGAARLTLSRAWETEPIERFVVRLEIGETASTPR